MTAYRDRHWAAMGTTPWQEGEGTAARHGRLYTYKDGSITSIRLTLGQQGIPSLLEITWRDGHTARWTCSKPAIDVYQDQFGLSVSKDGRFVFAQTWNMGLYCLNAETGEPVWRSQSRRGVTTLAIGKRTLVAHQSEYALLLMDLETGTVLKEKRPAKAWRFFPLNESHFLCRTTARQWEIIRAADLETVQIIPSFFFPSERGTSPWCIRDAWLEDGQLRVNAFRSADNDEIISEDFTVDSVLSTETQDSV